MVTTGGRKVRPGQPARVVERNDKIGAEDR